MKSNEALRRIVATTLVLAAAPVLAQTPAADIENNRTIENIIVTAQKREQSLQDVPIVVTAVSEQLLKDTGVKDIKDLQILTPGLIVTSSSSEASTTARIRGIGTVGDNPGLESSVGIVIDGVYRPRNGVGFGDLGELERIEVLKGPQGTLFGKNTSAGVINVVSKKPSKEFGADAELTTGNYGQLEGAASLTGPITNTLAGRIYFAGRERDGFVDVRTGPGPRTQNDDYDRSFWTSRGQLLFTPSSSLDVRLVADYAKRDESCCAAPQAVLTTNPAILGALNALGGGVGVAYSNPARPFARIAYSNRSSNQEIEDYGASAEVNWDMEALGGATLTSVTAYRNWEIVNAQDADFTTVDILYRVDNGHNGNRFRQRSQEFRLNGDTDRLNWLVGAFYAGEDLDSHNELLYGTQFTPYFGTLLGNPLAINALTGLANPFPGGLGQRDTYEQKSDSYALFTNDTLKITDGLEFTLGLRYTKEKKDLDTHYFNSHGGAGCQALRTNIAAGRVPVAAIPTLLAVGCATYADTQFNNLVTTQSIDEDEVSGTAKLAYRFNPSLMTYASFARGYKASGFNLDRERVDDTNPNSPADSNTSFKKELVDSYELGAKTQWLNDTLLLNSAVFYQDYTDFQLNTFTGLVFVVTSLPRVVSQGVDLDFLWYTPYEALTFQGGVTYAETEIREFGPALRLFATNRKDDTLSFAPKWSGSLSTTFEQPFASSMLFRANVGAKYMSEYNTGSNLAPTKIQGSMTLVNARVSIGADDEAWAIELWSQNLTDKDYYQVGFDATLQTGTVDAFLGAPRTYGVTARFKF